MENKPVQNIARCETVPPAVLRLGNFLSLLCILPNYQFEGAYSIYLSRVFPTAEVIAAPKCKSDQFPRQRGSPLSLLNKYWVSSRRTGHLRTAASARPVSHDDFRNGVSIAFPTISGPLKHSVYKLIILFHPPRFFLFFLNVHQENQIIILAIKTKLFITLWGIDWKVFECLIFRTGKN